MNKVIQVYKPIGKTPLEIQNQYKDPKETRYAYAGRLDPMAHGSLLILCGDETKKIDQYNQKTKKYKFQMVVGIETDTTDVLGLPQKSTDSQEIDTNTIVKKYHGLTYDQEYHIFSSMTAPNKAGKKVPLWKLATDGELPENIPKKEVTVSEFELKQMFTLTGDELKELILTNLCQLTSTGQFREKEIKKKWNEFKFQEKYYVYEFDATVSSGTYIRQLVKDIGRDLGLPTMVIDLYRYPFEGYDLLVK